MELVQSSLDDAAQLEAAFQGADAAIHGAGDYRIGIRDSDKPAMWDANVGTTERVLDAAIRAGVPRILYLSTLGVMGNTRGRLVDETYRRDSTDGFLSWYDETKYRAHEAAEARIAAGAPIVIVMPSQVYGPNDHSITSRQLELAHAGKLRYVALGNAGAGLGARPRPRRRHRRRAGQGTDRRGVPARGRVPPSRRGGRDRGAGRRPATAAHGRAHGVPPPRRPRSTTPPAACRACRRTSRETIASGEGVTYWGNHDKAAAELGFAPRTLAQGVADTWGGTPS